MARIDITDYLTDRLSTVTGIPFARDAWVNAAPEQYGVVELGGAVEEMWADGKLIDAVYRVTVIMFVSGSADDWPETVQEALEAMEAEGVLTGTHHVEREFDINTGKVQWTWNLNVYGPLILEGDNDGTTGG